MELSAAKSALLHWYDTHRRALPWRDDPHPYEVWLCEIIMQQTRINQGLAYWERFRSTWPDVQSLARASEMDVLKAWQGLGYYSRARNLHRAARYITEELGGAFPTDAAEWRNVPGVGPYTAAAIVSICFGEVIPAIDGNAIRVISRFTGWKFAVDDADGKRWIQQIGEAWISTARPGDFNQAVMELGALVCSPKAPDCDACPLREYCSSRVITAGQTPVAPVKKTKTKSQRIALDFHIISHGNRILMQQRPTNGIWAGLWEFPSLEVDLPIAGQPEQMPLAPFGHLESIGTCGPNTIHILSHRQINVRFWAWHSKQKTAPKNTRWLTWDEAETLPIPRLLERHWEIIKNSQEAAAS